MPHKFSISCYSKKIAHRTAAPGDVVYLKSDPTIAMTVREVGRWSSAAHPGKEGETKIETTWLKADHEQATGSFLAHELSV